MEKIIDGILTAALAIAVAYGGHYTLRQIYNWSRMAALQKAAQGLGKLEPGTRKMTGGKLDF